MERLQNIAPQILRLINHLCALEQRLNKGVDEPAKRSVVKMKEQLGELGLFYEYPLGQAFSETRTDVDAHIAGNGTENLRIVEVFKPIIRLTDGSGSRIIQNGVVTVSTEQEPNHE